MYKLNESLEEECEVNLFDLSTEQEAFEAALSGNPITIPADWNEEENFYLTEKPEENENYQTTEDFYFIKFTETEPADVIVEPPSYDQKDKTKTKVHLTYQALRNMARLRNYEDSCLKALTYAYHLGELLETKPKTPAQ
ncbi:3442_t:CDS:2 [Cetraspora pellucida]|uniref:3442_t:CDS:1 n=1 Tax=Cetraspora pellucida TaxID=1433469 RepID=A0ACA9M361_9GLOM|nr:3442_t:CDS:2 [Cetraspora pellucida]